MAGFPRQTPTIFEAGRVTESQFRNAWQAYNGIARPIAKELGISPASVRRYGKQFGLGRERYLSAGEAARILGENPSIIQAYCRLGIIPAVKISGMKQSTWHITPRTVEEFKGKIDRIIEVRQRRRRKGMPAKQRAEGPDGWYTVKEAAKILHYSKSSISHMCKAGVFETVKTPRGAYRIKSLDFVESGNED